MAATSASLLLVLLLSLLPLSLAQQSCQYGDPKVPPVGTGPAADRTSSFSPTSYQLSSLQSLTNFVILVLSEDGYDNLMGAYPGGNNLAAYYAANADTTQKTPQGTAWSSFSPDPSNLLYQAQPNAVFDLLSANASLTLSTILTNPSHSFFQTQYKINGGRMDQFYTWGDSHATVGMSYYNLSSAAPNNGLWGLANQYTLFDRFHVATFGDSVVAHLYLAGTGPVPFNASTPGQCPASVQALAQSSNNFAPVNSSGVLTDPTAQPGLSCDCWLIGDLNSANLCPGSGLLLPPIPAGPSRPAMFGDLADLAGVSWAWYSEDLLGAEAVNCTQSGQRQFNVHEQPFQHFSTFTSPTDPYWTQHQQDGNAFFPKLYSGQLEQVTWYAPAQTHDFGVSNNGPAQGTAFLDAFMANITAAPLWQQGKLGVIVTFSDANGMFDHVAPYVGDRFGPGLRVPTIFVSPFHNRSNNAAVNSQPFEHYSIHKMLARRFGIPQSSLQTMWGQTRFLAAADLTASFPTSGSSSTPSQPINGASQRSAGAALLLATLAATVLLLA